MYDGASKEPPALDDARGGAPELGSYAATNVGSILFVLSEDKNKSRRLARELAVAVDDREQYRERRALRGGPRAQGARTDTSSCCISVSGISSESWKASLAGASSQGASRA